MDTNWIEFQDLCMQGNTYFFFGFSITILAIFYSFILFSEDATLNPAVDRKGSLISLEQAKQEMTSRNIINLFAAQIENGTSVIDSNNFSYTINSSLQLRRTFIFDVNDTTGINMSNLVVGVDYRNYTSGSVQMSVNGTTYNGFIISTNPGLNTNYSIAGVRINVFNRLSRDNSIYTAGLPVTIDATSTPMKINIVNSGPATA